ncbi:MAG: LPXTG cell wall anchor domain-containing protein, partial [Acutalibacteraceae bacterium]|nr:LPXTG cell wall anchor domain-containing protein [Acutalibacteraceae bacterium]
APVAPTQATKVATQPATSATSATTATTTTTTTGTVATGNSMASIMVMGGLLAVSGTVVFMNRKRRAGEAE